MPNISQITTRFRSLNAENFYNSIVGESFTGVGSISGTTLTITAIVRGTVINGQYVNGQGIASGTRITAFGTGTGGTGTYTVNTSQTVSGNNVTTSFYSTTRLYAYIGRPNSWTNDNTPPAPSTSLQSEQYDFYRDMIAMKRILPSDVRYATSRYDWANNTVYTQHTDTNESLTSSQFYVYTTDRNVYKCIDNNYGAASTTMPTGTSTSIVTTADQYRWKYMYTISLGDFLKFTSSAYIPVKTLLSDDSSVQWTVQQNAANGAIHHIAVANSGSGYYLVTNSFSSIINSTAFVLGSYGSTATSIYGNSSIFISSGLGAAQLRKIISYTGSSKILTVNTAFSPIPNTSSKFIIGPTLIIRGDSGKSVSNRTTAYVSRPMNVVGGITRITVANEGRNYSTANVIFNSFIGGGARATPIISPPGIHGVGGLHGPGGHGSDAVQELNAFNIMLGVTLAGTEANSFPSNNDFRTVGVLKDPLLRSGTSNFANATVIDQTTRVYVNTVTGSGLFVADELITGGTSGVKGRLVVFANTNSARSQGILKLVRVTPAGTGDVFTVGETVTGATSGYTGTVTSVSRPAVKEYTGDVLYSENRIPIIRDPDQSERLRILVKF